MVAYLRVSTDKQGRSGLGIEAQAAAVAQHIRLAGCELLATYTEVETGTKDRLENRPALRKAIAHAKRCKGTLVVAKLDRLARSVAVTSMLHQSNVDFVCVDNPSANRLTVQILSAVAEAKARAISERTKAALAAYKARGGRLGAIIAAMPKPDLRSPHEGRYNGR
jgi:DNA invertase Pin-like site-specific DNA recombinase